MDNEELERLAVEELLKEAKRGKERSNTMGPSGWQKNLVPTANKRFLRQTLASTLHSQKVKEKNKDETNVTSSGDSESRLRNCHDSDTKTNEAGTSSKRDEKHRFKSSRKSFSKNQSKPYKMSSSKSKELK